MLEFSKAKVIDIVDETPNTKRFFLEMEGTNNFDFQPGQFITLDLPIHEKKNKRIRSYSIASAPNGTNIIELVIVLLEGGAGTTYLFNEIKIGSEIDYRGALGHFVLPENIPNDLFLICTGTGIAPFRSMIHYLHASKKDIPNITLIYGTRVKTDILYYQEFLDLANKIPNFKYIPVLSREKWDGAKGYVHAQYLNLCKDIPEAQFMLCGWRAMIDEARENLKTLGYGKENVHFELYG
jgi:ferredoxin-NADP reductase